MAPRRTANMLRLVSPASSTEVPSGGEVEGIDPGSTASVLTVGQNRDHPRGRWSQWSLAGQLAGQTEKSAKPESVDSQSMATQSEEKSSGGTYEIKRILDQRIQHGKQEYLVHWKGYPVEEATWEPQDHFDGLDAINRFWKERRALEKQTATQQQPRRSTRQAAGHQTKK
jgi:hypothetical protein